MSIERVTTQTPSFQREGNFHYHQKPTFCPGSRRRSVEPVIRGMRECLLQNQAIPVSFIHVFGIVHFHRPLQDDDLLTNNAHVANPSPRSGIRGSKCGLETRHSVDEAGDAYGGEAVVDAMIRGKETLNFFDHQVRQSQRPRKGMLLEMTIDEASAST
ncbi:hypothetical protein K490DRAFT_55287 [Saccharata proteae CBS 121410]|uniref:Uncharacterized protein n=1 Tax=Saccharata proteae CBS 121410 TaxID=1314787 RepID=A0A6A5YDD5_9PEZI|nr:hypothetical protein K490DRAFT_55287 [Saccharata proteae CBS 121410]